MCVRVCMHACGVLCAGVPGLHCRHVRVRGSNCSGSVRAVEFLQTWVVHAYTSGGFRLYFGINAAGSCLPSTQIASRVPIAPCPTPECVQTNRAELYSSLKTGRRSRTSLADSQRCHAWWSRLRLGILRDAVLSHS